MVREFFLYFLIIIPVAVLITAYLRLTRRYTYYQFLFAFFINLSIAFMGWLIFASMSTGK